MKFITDPLQRFPGQWLISLLFPLLLFWFILFLPIPDAFKQYFHRYNVLLFLIVLVLYYFSFRLPGSYETLAALGLTMLLTALCLSYIWSSGFSDNFLISGLVPYKDAKNYFFGSQLLLTGSPMLNAGQATERPLFPSFLAALLWLTGQNLKITLAISAQLVALGIYLSSRQVSKSLGAVAASLYATLLYFYIQPMLGYTMSETLGFIAGCLGFALIWSAAWSKNRTDLMIGILVLLLAVSARAGTFFIFPLLALWIGWIFRGESKLSVKALSYALLGIMLGYLLVNSAYSRLLQIPPGASFANFSYALYGQVRGGTGWHSAIEDLGTRNPSVVYAESWKFFQQHPTSLLIGFAKAYWDFFLPGDGSVFPFGRFGLQNWPSSLLWIATMILLILGMVHSMRAIGERHSALALAGFLGIFLSIPFLPPIDGGSRFYAGTAPFFFVLPALGTTFFARTKWMDSSLHDDRHIAATLSRYISVALLLLTLILTPLIFSFARPPAISATVCPDGQEPFHIEYHRGSYVDLIQPGSSSCGFIPEICQDDFERNNVEKSIDDFYQTILQYLHNGKTNARIIPAVDSVQNKFHYFYVETGDLAESTPEAMTGCAVEVLTKNQSIYKVESWSLVPRRED